MCLKGASFSQWELYQGWGRGGGSAGGTTRGGRRPRPSEELLQVERACVWRGVGTGPFLFPPPLLPSSIFFICLQSQGCRAKGITASYEQRGPRQGPQMARLETRVWGCSGESPPRPASSKATSISLESR